MTTTGIFIRHRRDDTRQAAGRLADDLGDELGAERIFRVVPVLVDGAALPSEADLPEDPRPPVRRQALAIEDGRWRSDVARLAESLARVGGVVRPSSAAAFATPVAAPQPASGSLRKGIMIGVAAMALLPAALVMYADENVAGTWARAEPEQAFVITQDDDGKLQATLTGADGTIRRGSGKVSRSKLSFEIPAPPAALRSARRDDRLAQ